MLNWFFILELLYLLVLVIVCVRIIYDTSSTVKTLAYLMLVIFLPLFGIFFYFAFGINYRKRELYSKKIISDTNLSNQ
jgi:cardiolipin synthase